MNKSTQFNYNSTWSFQTMTSTTLMSTNNAFNRLTNTQKSNSLFIQNNIDSSKSVLVQFCSMLALCSTLNAQTFSTKKIQFSY